MKYYSMRILLAVAFAILPLYESGAASDLSTSWPGKLKPSPTAAAAGRIWK